MDTAAVANWIAFSTLIYTQLIKVNGKLAGIASVQY